uniref:Protein kinase domain-containing protein n=1 Tax=Chromera velia CCMP2878 TaxID=1169474 RepID=A0A0G4HVJ3_9ALVE|eukprot:Cvel_8818.t1-p1 / transcript=Cvel_8818.t1 / gene=Cvel_8818 / organism=Chromera_velia_CCMP2878 / gene_product=Serine/threonine-protein kinase ULK3, putative / transcript_product=Serine/threonine-protein kinase ULK3, putative / location=Cvel_scaffold494:38577-47576(-) / protein_length=1146 / sequence_SO=supercontig / SO=protein_coding / is_pseudo=false
MPMRFFVSILNPLTSGLSCALSRKLKCISLSDPPESHRKCAQKLDIRKQKRLFGEEVTTTRVEKREDPLILSVLQEEQSLGCPLFLAGRESAFQALFVYFTSVGAILFEMLFGRPPFDGPNPTLLLKNIEAVSRVELPANHHLSPEVSELLHRLLTVDPTQRMTSSEFLSHPFVVAPLSALDRGPGGTRGEGKGINGAALVRHPRQAAGQQSAGGEETVSIDQSTSAGFVPTCSAAPPQDPPRSEAPPGGGRGGAGAESDAGAGTPSQGGPGRAVRVTEERPQPRPAQTAALATGGEKMSKRSRPPVHSDRAVLLQPCGVSSGGLCFSSFFLSAFPQVKSLSDLATQRESFGLAWLSAFLKTKDLERNENKKIPFEFPRGLDLSGVRGLSPEEIYILLNALPSTVEEIKLDSRAVRGRALPLLDFLKRVAAGRDGKTEAPRLKSITFAENSVGPEEASQVLPLLLPSLEHLCLKGNPLGSEGIRAVAEGVKEGNAASLRVLDLQATGLEKEGLETLCEAVREKSMKVESLNLSGNKIGGLKEMQGLSSVLCMSSLPSLREILVRECRLTDEAVKPLTESMGRRDLPNLEVLDLGGNCFEGRFLCDLGGALRAGGVPRLMELRVNDAWRTGLVERKFSEAFFGALSAPECPSDLCVRGVCLFPSCEEEVRALGACRYPSMRTLGLRLSPNQVTPFLEEMKNADKGRKYEMLDLHLSFNENANQRLRLVGEAIEGGHFCCVRKLGINTIGFAGWEEEENIEEGKSALFSSLSHTKLPMLSEFHKWGPPLTDADITRFAEAVRVGNISGLRVLQLGGLLPESAWFGSEGMEALMGSVVESAEGLPFLEKIRLSCTRAGEGGVSLGGALMSGKLPKLSDIDLSSSRLTDEGLGGLGHAVREGGLVGVAYLNLSRNEDIGRDSWELCVGGPLSVALASGKLPSLTFLGRFSLSLDETGVGDLGEAVRAGGWPPGFTEMAVTLGQTGVNLDEVIRAIGESEIGLPSFVRSLNLSCGRLSEEALASLAANGGGASGGKLSHLKHLDLSSCGFDDARVRRLGEVFSAHECRELERIDLNYNRISTEGLSAFLEALSPQSLPKLRSLSLKSQNTVQGEELGVREQRETQFISAVSRLRAAAQRNGKLLKWTERCS